MPSFKFQTAWTDITIMAATISPVLGIYLKQFLHVSDQIADCVNVYGFWKTAKLIENSTQPVEDSQISTLPVELTNSTYSVELTDTFNEYGNVALGIIWLPGTFSSIHNYLLQFFEKNK